MKRNWGMLGVCCLFCTLAPLSMPAGAHPLAADPSAASEQQPTADQAKNDKSDVMLMQQIRKALVDDKSLSTNAHNVKIIANHGRVILRGPVNSEEEKRAVEQKASEVAGQANVTSEITIRHSK
jgi:hyperosmotically inducible periplasmic protein